MYYNLVVMKNNFGEKLGLYREWWKKFTNHDHDSEFAYWLDMSPTSVNNWIKTGNAPRDDSLERLASKIGPQVYDWAGRLRPDGSSPLDDLPENLRAVLFEWSAVKSANGWSGDEPEAGREIIRILESHGLKIPDSPNPSASSK